MTWNKERYASDPKYRRKVKAIAKAWNKANRQKITVHERQRLETDPKFAASKHDEHLRRKYGITLEDYKAMVERQDGLCRVCRRRPTEKLHVDHCHDAMMLRSLLCRGCNFGLGEFEDNPEFLRAGADYLEIWRIIHARKGPDAKRIPNKGSKPKKRKRTGMSSNITSHEESKATRMMRHAILHELHFPPGPNEAPPDNMLQQIARALVQKAGQGDVTAMKEVLDRVDDKTIAPPPDADDRPTKVNVSWGEPQ